MDCLRTRYLTSLFLFLAFVFPPSLHALVDYSEEESVPVIKKSKPKPRIKRLTNRAPKNGKKTSASKAKNFEINTYYESISILETKVSKIKFNAHFQTDYNLFLDIDYFTIQSNNPNENDIASRGYERGNPSFLIGLNWLEFGKAQEKVSIDLLAGLSYKSTGPHVSSRTDKLIALQTMKRFNNFVLGLTYEMRLTGTPDDQREQSIGNITTIGAEIGVMVSHDIQFSLLAQSVKIKKSTSEDRQMALGRNISFSYVIPKLTLGISPSFSFELGAVFQTDRIRDDRLLLSARLWNLQGVYGNSLFAGLNLFI